MSNRDVDIPVKAETREWLIKTKGDLTYDRFLNEAKAVLEMIGDGRTKTLFFSSETTDGFVTKAQALQLSRKDGMEVTAKNG